MCMAEKASKACMTYGVVAPILSRLLGLLLARFIVVFVGAVLDLRGDMAGPQCKTISVNGSQLVVEHGDVIDQAEVFERVEVRHRGRVQVETREREDACSLPLGDGGFDLRRPHQIGLVRSGGPVGVGNLDVIVRAANLVLGAVAAENY